MIIKYDPDFCMFVPANVKSYFAFASNPRNLIRTPVREICVCGKNTNKAASVSLAYS